MNDSRQTVGIETDYDNNPDLKRSMADIDFDDPF